MIHGQLGGSKNLLAMIASAPAQLLPPPLRLAQLPSLLSFPFEMRRLHRSIKKRFWFMNCHILCGTIMQFVIKRKVNVS